MKDVTGVVVNYNTHKLLKIAIDSIRALHPHMKIIVIDGSDKRHPSFFYVHDVIALMPNVKVFQFNHNIGHGKGLDYGIRHADTKFCMLFDSDVEMNQDPLEQMVDRIKADNLYGIGQLVKINKHGVNDDNGFEYLHPHFCVVDRAKYIFYHPFIHHGAPFIKTMRMMYEKRLSKKLLRNFPVGDFVLHKERGTRVLNPKGFRSATWESPV